VNEVPASPVALARALTIVENDPAAAADLVGRLAAGRPLAARRIGVTGPPGAGKSTLVAALAGAWRARGRRVGILAVDPTSPFTGGALLGDRIRMGALSGDDGVFIRSLATRGAMGGLSRAVHDAADVLDAAGFDPIVVETVGVGQSEVAIASAADVVIVVVAPGSGDGVQAMKGGLLEAADVLVVNQADRVGADGLAAELEVAVELRSTGAKPPVLRTVATTGDGVPALVAFLDRFEEEEGGRARRDGRRLERARQRIRDEVDRRRAEVFWSAGRGARLDEAARDVAAGRTTAAGAASTLLGDSSPPARG
jgi:LAO/AO transport system kinase